MGSRWFYAACVHGACTVCARRQSSRLVLGRARNVNVGGKPSRPSNAVEIAVGVLIFFPSHSPYVVRKPSRR